MPRTITYNQQQHVKCISKYLAKQARNANVYQAENNDKLDEKK